MQWNSAVTLNLPEGVADQAAADQAAYEAMFASPSPPPPPPTPEVCDTQGCIVAKYEGPRGLAYVAPPLTSDTLYLEIFRNIHLHTGIPYAWGGRHSGWLKDAIARNMQCAKEVDPTIDPANGDPTYCRCFLDYLTKFNMTADGLYICHDATGTDFVHQLRAAMPRAEFLTTIRDPWEHAMDSWFTFQAPITNMSTATMMPDDDCTYDGPGYRDRFTPTCFTNLYVDPKLKECKADDASMFSSQLCAVGTKAVVTADDVEAHYTVIPTEDAVTPLLAKLLDFGVSPEVVYRIHDSLESGCKFGSQLATKAPHWINETHATYPGMLNESMLATLSTTEANFIAYCLLYTSPSPRDS